ncbi:MAG: hypothetical protein C5B50_21585 [Verrucomicrobia bacterium]|nr:MAG: hypothetical protein C5B50_21585 [Verrucomicrobiota bacterium]
MSHAAMKRLGLNVPGQGNGTVTKEQLISFCAGARGSRGQPWMKRHVDPWLRSMNKKNWRDDQGRAIHHPFERFASYANACGP